LEWHQLKQAAGLFIAAVPCRVPDIAVRVAAMPVGEVAQFLTALRAPADEADRLKRRGLYVDVVRGGRILDPAEMTGTEVRSQLAQAGQATSAAGQLLEPETQARLINPVAEAVELTGGVQRAHRGQIRPHPRGCRRRRAQYGQQAPGPPGGKRSIGRRPDGAPDEVGRRGRFHRSKIHKFSVSRWPAGTPPRRSCAADQAFLRSGSGGHVALRIRRSCAVAAGHMLWMIRAWEHPRTAAPR